MPSLLSTPLKQIARWLAPSAFRQKKSPAISTEAEATRQFLELNAEPFAQLITFVDFAPDSLSLAFASVNFAKDRERLLRELQNHPQCQEVQFAVLSFPDPKLRFFRDSLVAILATLPRQPDKKLFLIITDLEASIGMVGNYPPMLVDLNYVRDGFTNTAPHPILFCLPDYALTRLARFAPDFWDWRTGIFLFKSLPETVNGAMAKTLESDKIRESLLLPERQERIDLLQRLLMHYGPSGKPPDPTTLATHMRILNELGITYYGVGEMNKAEEAYRGSLQLATEAEEVAKPKASALHHLAILKADQGDREGAIDLYQQSLQITEQIGDVKTKAATLHQLAILKADQGDREGAIDLYQQSLQIHEQIGNVQGKAATLHNLASLKAHQGDREGAIDLFQESLQIQRQIGSLPGIAPTLTWLAGLAEQHQDYATALTYQQEAVAIYEKIRSPHLNSARQTLQRLEQLCQESPDPQSPNPSASPEPV